MLRKVIFFNKIINILIFKKSNDFVKEMDKVKNINLFLFFTFFTLMFKNYFYLHLLFSIFYFVFLLALSSLTLFIHKHFAYFSNHQYTL